MADASRILIVDDEQSLREFLEIFLKKQGFDVETAPGGAQAIERLDRGPEPDLVLTDLMMPEVDGMSVLEHVQTTRPDIQVLMMTAFATADTAIEAMKKGAFDYIQKPFKNHEIQVVIDKALAQKRLLEENRSLREQVQRSTGLGGIVGRSDRMQQVFDLVQRVADTRTSVLVTGANGTGKGVIAKAIHESSSRSEAPFITVNCGAIPESLIESELFGHVKGAFTGAHADKAGLFAAAHTGTIFLDEIGELPMHLQVRLLRVLQERRIRPVGAAQEQAVDVRVVAATNQDLEGMIQDGRFREDLYYRLNVIRLEMPDLRDRRADIPLIARHFLVRFNAELGKSIEDFSKEAMEVLLAHDYPGNVRELENAVERAVTFETEALIQPSSLPPGLGGGDAAPPVRLGATVELPEEGMEMERLLENLERSLITQALERTRGNRTEAARILGISFRAIRYKLDKYEMAGDSYGGRSGGD